jgi:hypothetical protein
MFGLYQQSIFLPQELAFFIALPEALEGNAIKKSSNNSSVRAKRQII